MSTHNICFRREIRKINIMWIAPLICSYVCDPVNFCRDEFGIKKFLIIINNMMVFNFIIMGVSLH